MTDTPQIRETLAWRIWIAIRFIVFGAGGFIALWISWLSLIFAFDPPSQRLFSTFVAVPLALVGALMMLYGGGQWGRWAYLWVSVPIVITLLGMLSGLDFVFAKPLLLVGIPLPMVVSYLLVRRYYRLQDKQKLRQQS
jgi:hypothetical protein